ncbi:VanZ family protein [Bacillus sp. BRMEA1]|uniref:VanZ family protein n=1 Tax=Neobacillus endophyticus TaxID=2738405 RepID=UPI001565DEC5|nr:VanZ family protein [Neobacillus endophyticus]
MFLHNGRVIIVFGLLIYLAGRIVLAMVNNKKRKPFLWTKEIIKLLFAIYILLVVSVTLFPIIFPPFMEKTEIYRSINLMPLISIIKEVSQIGIAYDGDTQFMIGLILRNVGGNILLLMPLGFFAPILLSKYTSFKKAVLLGLFTSIGIECLQLIELLLGIAFSRTVDIDDVICNVMGASIGYLIYKIMFGLSEKYQIKIFQNLIQEKVKM